MPRAHAPGGVLDHAHRSVMYTDSVGPGIYGGKVQRDEMGKVIIGRQFQVQQLLLLLW